MININTLIHSDNNKFDNNKWVGIVNSNKNDVNKH